MFRRWHQVTALALTAALITSSCGGKDPEGPTVAEAEKSLRAQVNAALGGAAPRNPKVTDPGGRDLPCEQGKVKRTYAVVAENKTSAALTPVEIKNRMVGSLSKLTEFTITEDNRATYDGEPSQIKIHNKVTRTWLRLSVPSRKKIEVHGATECLRRG
ncbi:hypothetical protein [Actinomadura keratinilytica]|jgi:hypothetical protein|uniref:Lipoprotein n=1 Tax=Actinomadura keratinilytica TaxID=547461 RepID=A0ABP7YU96_9ACTN